MWMSEIFTLANGGGKNVYSIDSGCTLLGTLGGATIYEANCISCHIAPGFTASTTAIDIAGIF